VKQPIKKHNEKTKTLKIQNSWTYVE